MEFEWNDAKAASNLTRHGVSFEEALTVFDDPLYLDYYDPDHSQEERRYIRVGQSKQGRFLLVAYTERGETTRIISARWTTPEERRVYENET